MIVHFDNGYGASVITDGYGGDLGLYELAVIDTATGQIMYNTPITNDVLGYLTAEDVEQYLERIRALPNIDTATDWPIGR